MRRQRPDPVKRPHRGQYGARLGSGVPQQRGDRGGQLAHRPGGGEVAEVDHAVRHPKPVLQRADQVVVGQVGVDGLPRQVPGQRLHPRPGLARRRLDPVPQRLVADVPGQLGHHPAGVPQVPLQHPVQARVGEVAQCPADLPGHRADARHDPRRQVLLAAQRAAAQVAQHPRGRRAVRGGHQHRAVRGRRRPQPGRRGGQVRGRLVLGRDLGRAERRVGDLQHAEHGGVRPDEQEVGVLLAAQRVGVGNQAELGRDPFGFLGADHRHRQCPVAEEVHPGAGPGTVPALRG